MNPTARLKSDALLTATPRGSQLDTASFASDGQFMSPLVSRDRSNDVTHTPERLRTGRLRPLDNSAHVPFPVGQVNALFRAWTR
jgi:hypothetical protein